jgi:hypothetical protein
MKFRLNDSFTIDSDLYKREGLRLGILAMSGHGKSNAAADVVEDALDQGAQVIIIEPIPEWHTLKARYNNVVVVGGPYQDLPLEPAFAHEYVKSALEKGISLVVNVSDIEDETEQVKFVSSFLWNLYRLEQKYRRVLFLVLEEADTWAPQMWDQNTKQSLSRVSLIAKHGRKIGIFPILVSQRPADLHKSPLSQCNINLFGRFSSPADLSEKTGIMFVVKKQHLPITEKQIMELENGSFVVSDKQGVHTVAVRKRLCPHGADTPLIEAKPFSADLSQALGGLRDEIVKALEAKKDEDSLTKRQEKEISQLKQRNKDLEEKAKIKLNMKEMMEDSKAPLSRGEVLSNVKLEEKVLAYAQQLRQDKALFEEYESGRKIPECIQARLKFLADIKVDLEKRIKAMETALHDYDDLRGILSRVLKVQNIYDQIHNAEERMAKNLPTALPSGGQLPTGLPTGQVALQHSVTVVDVPSIEKLVAVSTETMRGKILTIAKKGKLETWRRLDDIVKAVQEERWNATPQEVNNALNELEKQDLVAKKHTDRNYYCLAQGVKFQEASS